MRKKGIIILLVILSLIAVIAFFTRDRYIERALESAGQDVAGAKVEIDGFHFSLFTLTCSWDRLQVADRDNTWRNILETGRVTFSMEARPLFWRRVIIKEMSFENARSGTKRETDGFIPEKRAPRTDKKPGMVEKAKAALAGQMKELPVLDLSRLGKELQIDSLVNLNNLETFRGYSELKQFADSAFTYWKQQEDPKSYDDRLAKLEADIASLNLDNIKNVIALAEALKKIRDIQKNATSLKNDVTGTYTSLTRTFTDLDTRLKDVDAGLQSDVEKAQRLAKLRDLDVKDVSLLLFGDPLVHKAEKLLDFVALARTYLPTAGKALSHEKKKTPSRFKGQDIRFPFKHRYPKFLLRKAHFSAASAAGDTSKAFFLDGTVTGVTTEPELYGEPTSFSLTLKKTSGNTYGIRGIFDHTAALPHDSLKVTAANVNLGEIMLQSGDDFPRTVNAPACDLSLSGIFGESALDITLNMDAAPVTFSYNGEADNRISRIVRDVLAGLTRVTLSAQLKGDTSGYTLRMNSNVDRMLARQIRTTLENTVRQAQQQVEAYVRSEADSRRKEIQTLIGANRLTTFAEVDTIRQQLQIRMDEIEKRKKEIERRISGGGS